MGKFTVIPSNTFPGLQMDAGVLLKTFNPETGDAPKDEDIICATTGGINPTCVPTYSDLGEDVDNCPVNMKELKHLDGWECKMAFTSLGTSAELIRMALGAADINAPFDKTLAGKLPTPLPVPLRRAVTCSKPTFPMSGGWATRPTAAMWRSSSKTPCLPPVSRSRPPKTARVR